VTEILRKKQIVVIGSSEDTDNLDEAYSIGKFIALKGYVLITGGRGGIMEAASRGAAEQGGIVIGVLPSERLNGSNPYCGVVIPTGMGSARNVINVLSADVIIAIGGKAGTLTELGYAWLYQKPVICCAFSNGWSARFPALETDDRRGSIVLTARSVKEACAQLEDLIERDR
jgi:uncharacterized protein (TIGR00725 family)